MYTGEHNRSVAGIKMASEPDAPKTFINSIREIDYNETWMILHFLHLKLSFLRDSLCIYSLPLEWNTLGDAKLQHNCKTFQICLKNNLLDEIP